jgi:hypothetical protein
VFASRAAATADHVAHRPPAVEPVRQEAELAPGGGLHEIERGTPLEVQPSTIEALQRAQRAALDGLRACAANLPGLGQAVVPAVHAHLRG